jgi:hypothetical protein
MAEFTFNLDSLKAQAAKFESSLFANVKDADLIYKGDDYIAWDRTNAERLRRGLPSLTSIGYPRPPQDAPAGPVPEGSTVPNPQGTSSTFKVKGPPGLTAEQAFAIFKKQADTGSLVGFKPGDSLSAASQAADGLASAQAALQQAQGGVSGSLGSFTSALSGAGVDLATGRIASVDAAFASGGLSAGTSALTNFVGSIAPGLGDAGGALNGSLAGITPGLTAVHCLRYRVLVQANLCQAPQ